MSEVKRYIEQRREEVRKLAGCKDLKRVTVRLTVSQHEALVDMSELLGTSPTGLAEALINAAILDAYPEVMP